MFSIMNNGLLDGYFLNKQILRQRYLISPLLFVSYTNYLTRILNKITTKGLVFHKNHKKMGLSHLCFVDDLLVFTD